MQQDMKRNKEQFMKQRDENIVDTDKIQTVNCIGMDSDSPLLYHITQSLSSLITRSTRSYMSGVVLVIIQQE